MPRSRVQPGLTDAQFGKVLVFANSLVPLAMLLLDLARHQTGPDPTNYILHVTGMTALVFIMLTLTVTPLRRLTGKSFFMHFRRMLGLFAFFYACLHFLAYLQFQRGWAWAGVLSDALHQRYIFFGMAALALMIPLALTSTTWSIRKFGAAAWKRLHKLVYLTAICAVIHYCLLVKAIGPLPKLFILTLAALLAFRLIWSLITRLNQRPRPRPIPARP